MSFWNRNSEEKYSRLRLTHAQAIINAAPIPMGLIDEGGMCAINDGWRTLLGASIGEETSSFGVATGNAVDAGQARIHPADAPEFDRRLAEIMGGIGDWFELRVVWLRADGVEIPCQVTLFALSITDGSVGPRRLAVVSLHELSAEVERQRQCQTAETSQRMLAATAAVLVSATSTDEIWPAVLCVIGENGGWDAGIFWQGSSTNRGLSYTATWKGAASEGQLLVASLHQRVLQPNTGLPWEAWEQGEPCQIPDLHLAHRLIHTARAETAGLGSEVCIPVLLPGQYGLDGSPRFAGVLDFFSREVRQDSIADIRPLTSVVPIIERALERIEADRPLRTEAEKYRGIADNAVEAIVTIDLESRIEFVNAATERLFGYTHEEMLGQSLTMLMPANMRDLHLAGIRRFVQTNRSHLQWENLELPGRHKDGSDLLLRMTIAEVGSKENRRFTGYMRDITAEKREESALVYQALHDALTDLPNRTLLQERLNRCILVSRRHNQPSSLLVMDLDRFKDVNDTFGHHLGDLLLKQVTARLQRTMRESDTVARLGGDEFAVLLPSTDERGAILAAHRIANALKTPVTIDSHNFDVGLSIGIAHFPDHGNDCSTLMRRAEIAMYAAKRTSSPHAIYSAERDEINSLRLVLINELRQAIEQDEMMLCYQPKVNLANGLIENVEALIRWQHPQRGLIPPDSFIPLAEESGLMKPLTLWVLNEALRQHRAWKEEGLDLRISVNFSARVLHDPDLVTLVTDLLRNWSVEPSRLEVEITESAIMVDPERAKETLTSLHATGTRTSIDDFGTGHSSLSYLRRLPFDEIKIDKSFVLDMATSRDDASIVRSVVALGHNFDLRVVAEGVDNQRTLDMLRMMGCDLAQGFFLSRPVTADKLSVWIRERETLANAS